MCPAVPVATFSSLLQCSLHIHASYSISQKLNVPMAPLSEPNAVGIVIAHGTDPTGAGTGSPEPRAGPHSDHPVSPQAAWGGPSR